MAKHTVTIIQPARTTLHSDYTMEIKSDDAILGKLSISKGGVDWFPKHSKKPWALTWEEFAVLLDAYCRDRRSVKAFIKNLRKG